jgi:uncharacterized membrane protein (UPF0182 family)
MVRAGDELCLEYDGWRSSAIFVDNVPAESQYGSEITQPAIYFGNVAPGYKIVSTGIKEFDYPEGQ